MLDSGDTMALQTVDRATNQLAGD